MAPPPTDCEIYRHLLAYSSSVPSDACTAATPAGGATDGPPRRQSFLATTDQWGRVPHVFPLRTPSGASYAGSTTGIALSRDKNTLWVCGQQLPNAGSAQLLTGDSVDWTALGPSEGGSDAAASNVDDGWHLSTYQLTSEFDGWDVAPDDGDYAQSELTACIMQPLPPSVFPRSSGSSKDRCSLSWDDKTQTLWVGNLARPEAAGSRGVARGYHVESAGCDGGSGGDSAWVPVLSGPSRSQVEYGPLVTSFGFLTDSLGDDVRNIRLQTVPLALARADHFYTTECHTCVAEV